jgi:hypothetical protein
MMEEPYKYAGGKLMMRAASEHIAIAIGMTLRDLHLRDNIHLSRTELYPAFINSSSIQLTDIEDYFVLFCEAFTHMIWTRNNGDLKTIPEALKLFKENTEKPLRNSGARVPTLEKLLKPRIVPAVSALAPIISDPKVSEKSTKVSDDPDVFDDDPLRTNTKPWKEWKDLKTLADVQKPLHPIPPPPPHPSTSNSQMKPPTKEELVIRTRA